MKNREKRNFWKSLSAIMFAFVLLIMGACFISFDGNEVQAEGTIVMSTDGRYGVIPVGDVVKGTDDIPVYDNYLFAGWMEQSGDTYKVVSSKSKATHAKFVPEELLTIKAQSTQDVVNEVENSADGNKYAGKYVLRLVSSVESLDYYSVGFEVVDKEGTIYTNTTDDVCYRIDSTTQGAEYTFSPKVMDVESEYFITAKFPVEPDKINDLYTVRAFWTTKDGTRVYGVPRCFAVSDGLKTSTTLNVSFVSDNEVTENQSLSVAYDADNDNETPDVQKTAIVIGYDETTKTAHTRITFDSEDDKASLKSVTQFNFSTAGEETVPLGSAAYRNLYTKYTETTVDDVTTNTADTSWYNTTDDEFVIATSADLYGLANIVNAGTDTFESNTIYLVSDIEVNKGTATTDGWKTSYTVDGKEHTDGTSYEWVAISSCDTEGKSTYAFNGTFDGQGHEISGVYAEVEQAGLGLFAATAEGSAIKNLKLVNSYFKNSSTYSYTGSIVGQCAGNLENVYSNAYVEAIVFSGGLIGSIYANSKNSEVQLDKCWFAGELNVQGNQQGGIVGRIWNGEITMTDCLNTGNINCNNRNFIGGLCGYLLYDDRTDDGIANTAITLKMERCLNYGKVDNTKKTSIGSIVGSLGKGASGSIENVYATQESYSKQVGADRKEISLNYLCVEEKYITLSETTDGDSIKNTLSNLDFNTIWAIDANIGTPILKWTTLVTE